jgi:hypothetical protein
VELRGEYVEKINFFNPVACCFLYKAKDLSALMYSKVSKLLEDVTSRVFSVVVIALSIERLRKDRREGRGAGQTGSAGRLAVRCGQRQVCYPSIPAVAVLLDMLRWGAERTPCKKTFRK